MGDWQDWDLERPSSCVRNGLRALTGRLAASMIRFVASDVVRSQQVGQGVTDKEPGISRNARLGC